MKIINNLNRTSSNTTSTITKANSKISYIQRIPTSLISDFEFENKLHRFCSENPSRQKSSKYAYHRKMNKLHKEKDHPRWAKAGKPHHAKRNTPFNEPMFVEDFLKLLSERS